MKDMDILDEVKRRMTTGPKIKEHARELGLPSLEKAQGDLTNQDNYMMKVMVLT